jgi:protein gp37
MGDKSAIQWTDASWNPSTGCSKVSSGCRNCYAERLSARLERMRNPKYTQGFNFAIHKDALDVPLKWNKPRKIFVNSMSDLFHELMPDDFLIKCFDIMTKADWHIYQILTKRPQRMLSFTKDYGKVPDHVWLGTSVELDIHKDRIDILRKVRSKIRFVSFEPLLGPIGVVNLSGISWVIVGGESGYNHRRVEPEWIREIKKQCKRKKVAFFFKQWGGITPKSNGRILDGREWNEFPWLIEYDQETKDRSHSLDPFHSAKFVD